MNAMTQAISVLSSSTDLETRLASERLLQKAFCDDKYKHIAFSLAAVSFWKDIPLSEVLFLLLLFLAASKKYFQLF